MTGKFVQVGSEHDGSIYLALCRAGHEATNEEASRIIKEVTKYVDDYIAKLETPRWIARVKELEARIDKAEQILKGRE